MTAATLPIFDTALEAIFQQVLVKANIPLPTPEQRTEADIDDNIMSRIQSTSEPRPAYRRTTVPASKKSRTPATSIDDSEF